MQSVAAQRWPLAGLLAVLVAYSWLAIGYANATPLWQNPDEPAHFNYVAQLARTGELPELRPGDWDAALLERLKNNALLPGDRIESIRYESWQPPLAYLAMVPAHWLAPDDSFTARVRTLRYWNALLGAITVALAYMAARTIVSAWEAVAVSGVLAGIPMFTAISASVTNDALTNLWAVVLTLIALSVFTRPITARQTAAFGVAIGIGLLIKPWLAIFPPVIALAALVGGSNDRQRSVRIVASMAIAAFVTWSPWLIHQGFNYGWNDLLASRRHDAVVVDQPRFPGLSPDYAAFWLTTMFHSFWAQFGWMAMPAPARLQWIWGALSLLALPGLVVATRRRTFCARPVGVLVGIVLLTLMAVVGYNLTFIQAQGRYLFPALVPLAILLVIGWGGWAPNRLRPAVVVSAAATLIGVNAFTLTRVVIPGFGYGL